MRNETSAFACAILTLVPCSLLLNRTEMLATQANTSLVSIALGSGEPISASVKTSNLFCSLGLHPLDPSRALPLYPTGGLGSPQTLRLVGGLRHPVPVTFFYSPATWNLFNNPGSDICHSQKPNSIYWGLSLHRTPSNLQSPINLQIKWFGWKGNPLKYHASRLSKQGIICKMNCFCFVSILIY